jgi:uncharacterized RDD family membrane protein YckC
LLLMCALLQSQARADTAPQSNVVAHASEDTLWVATVMAAPEIKPSGEKTDIRFRALNTADQSWHELLNAPLAGRVVQMAHRGQTAAVLLKSGEWMLLWPQGSSTGPSLPKRAKMLALASERDRNTLYAIGAGAPAATTESSENASTEPSPTTQSQINLDKPILYVFEGANWRALANCPDTIGAAPGEISLAVVDRMPMVAQQDAGGAIHVFQLDENQKWIDRGSVKPTEPPINFRLLSGTQRPMLWVGEKNSGGLLYFGGEKWLDPVQLNLSRAMSPINGSLVSAAGALRLFITDDKGKLYEQRFDNNGNRVGDLTALEAPQPLLPPTYDSWPMLAILAALAFMMLSSARRRAAEETDEEEEDQMILASSGQRLTAGLIDGVPIILSLLYMASNIRAMQDPTDVTWLLPVALAIGVYLLHTTLSELLIGRTLGKIVVGLQVVALDGKPAKPGAILVRNLLRVIDVFPVPLAFLILTSPMKQRLGDLLAGTVVIIGPRPPRAEDEEANGS